MAYILLVKISYSVTKSSPASQDECQRLRGSLNPKTFSVIHSWILQVKWRFFHVYNVPMLFLGFGGDHEERATVSAFKKLVIQTGLLLTRCAKWTESNLETFLELLTSDLYTFQINLYWLKFLISYHARCVLKEFHLLILFYLYFTLLYFKPGKGEKWCSFLFFPFRRGLT